MRLLTNNLQQQQQVNKSDQTMALGEICRNNSPKRDKHQRGSNKIVDNNKNNNKQQQQHKHTKTTYCCHDLNCSLNVVLNDKRHERSSVSSSRETQRSVSLSPTETTELLQQQQHDDDEEEDAQNDNNMQQKQQQTAIIDNNKFIIQVHLDMLSWLLFLLGLCTRFYKLSKPAHIV